MREWMKGRDKGDSGLRVCECAIKITFFIGVRGVELRVRLIKRLHKIMIYTFYTCKAVCSLAKG